MRDYRRSITNWIRDFRTGKHQFSPMKQYDFKGESIRVWSYADRLILHLILKIIKPTFKHVISPFCCHLTGPAAIRGMTAAIKTALKTKEFNYCLRLDIKSYYDSIDQNILLEQLYQNYDDPILRRYFEDIVTIGIDRRGLVILPKKGIPLRSSLLPFFGALYLTPLDRAFEKCSGIFYRRYMDDIIILTKTKSQYQRARRRLFKILRELKLKLSPHKTKMGKITKGFHFLGVDFGVTQILQTKIQVWTARLHSRTCRRALDRVDVMTKDAANRAQVYSSQTVFSRFRQSDCNQIAAIFDTKLTILVTQLRRFWIENRHKLFVSAQHKRLKWATWWYHTVKVNRNRLVENWIAFAEQNRPDLILAGVAVLLRSPYYSSASDTITTCLCYQKLAECCTNS